MKRTPITLALMIVAFVFGAVGWQPAQAAPLSVAFGSRLSSGCENGDTSFGITFGVPSPVASYTVHTIASAGGLVYMDEQFTANGTFFFNAKQWGIYDENDTGLKTGTWPIPPDIPVTVTIDFAGATSSVTYVCSTFAARPVPEGFVLRTITCTVAVFDSPNGNPVSGATIKGGQTWFVSPTSVAVTDNPKFPDWTEIYVSGSTDGFIPTACVGPRPSNYSGS